MGGGVRQVRGVVVLSLKMPEASPSEAQPRSVKLAARMLSTEFGRRCHADFWFNHEAADVSLHGPRLLLRGTSASRKPTPFLIHFVSRRSDPNQLTPGITGHTPLRWETVGKCRAAPKPPPQRIMQAKNLRADAASENALTKCHRTRLPGFVFHV